MELHIARCDAPDCQTEAPITRRGVLPEGWARIEESSRRIGDQVLLSPTALMCSWACVAAYAEQRAKEADDGR